MPETEIAAAPKPTKTKEERSQIAKDAAKRRWEAARKAAQKAARAKNKGKPAAKRSSGPREFSSALKIAEKRLGKAILERAEYAAKYAVVSAEIPSLQRLIIALKNPLGVMPEYGGALPPVTLEQIVGDQPLQYANPPRVPSALPPVPMQHPVTTQGRAGGGAIGVELPEGTEEEDQFLKDSAVAGGQWH